MKRSEANAIFRARVAFSSRYEAFSVKQGDDGLSEVYYSDRACLCCREKPGKLVEVNYLDNRDTRRGIYDRINDGAICNGCLVSLVNGDDSDLDFYVTDEDQPSESR